MAVSFQCMTKFTKIKKKISSSLNNYITWRFETEETFGNPRN